MNSQADSRPIAGVRGARSLFPATDGVAYLNTAAVGLASRALAAAYQDFVDEWTEKSLDYVRGDEDDIRQIASALSEMS
jgi:kynureninase